MSIRSIKGEVVTEQLCERSCEEIRRLKRNFQEYVKLLDVETRQREAFELEIQSHNAKLQEMIWPNNEGRRSYPMPILPAPK
jgi:hypothetical protein